MTTSQQFEKKTYTVVINSDDRNSAYSPLNSIYSSTNLNNGSCTFTNGSVAGNVLTVAGTVTGAIHLKSVVSGYTGTLPAGSYVVSFGTGTGAAGTYILSASGSVAGQAFQTNNSNNYSFRNDATFNINWEQILPPAYDTYKVAFSFGTSGGKYTDDTATNKIFSSAKIMVDFGTKSYSYDTSNKGTSMTLGLVYRDLQLSNSNSNTLSCWYLYNPARTIQRPSVSTLNVKIINQYSGGLLTDTYLNSSVVTAAQDMTPWTLNLEFIPCATSDLPNNL
jgi:hypothetical protein